MCWVKGDGFMSAACDVVGGIVFQTCPVSRFSASAREPTRAGAIVMPGGDL